MGLSQSVSFLNWTIDEEHPTKRDDISVICEFESGTGRTTDFRQRVHLTADNLHEGHGLPVSEWGCSDPDCTRCHSQLTRDIALGSFSRYIRYRRRVAENRVGRAATTPAHPGRIAANQP